MTLNLDIEICAMGNINFTIGQVLFFSFKAQLLLKYSEATFHRLLQNS